MKPARLCPALTLALLAGLSTSACRTVQAVADAPGRVTKALLPGQQAPDKRPISELHPTLLAFADFASQRIRAATEDFAETAGTTEARLQATEWRLNTTRTVLQSATGPVPLMGMLDLIVGIKAGQLILEDHLIPEVWGEPARPMLDALVASEARAWQVLGEFFTTEQIAGLEQALTAWEDSQQGMGKELGDDLPTFQEVVGTLSQEESEGGGFLGLIELDPLAGLEPMAREIALTRQFAERLLFWSERLPMLIDDQVELATLEAQQMPEVVQVLADVERVSLAVDRVATTAAGLPDQLSTEREAALNQAAQEVAQLRDTTLEQVSAELTAQREGLMRDLETAQAPLESLLGESRATLAAAESVTGELNALVAAVGVFLDRFERPEGEPPPEPSEPARPFDITEYGDTIERAGETVVELRELVAQIDQSLPQVETMVGATVQRAEEAIDHAFRRGLMLGLALIAAAAVAVLIVRRLSASRGAR